MLDIRINKFLFFLFGHRSISKYSLFTVDYGGFFSILYSVFVFVFVHVITFQINICWMFWIFCSFFLYSSHSQTDISHTNSVLCFFYLGKKNNFLFNAFFVFFLTSYLTRNVAFHSSKSVFHSGFSSVSNNFSLFHQIELLNAAGECALMWWFIVDSGSERNKEHKQLWQKIAWKTFVRFSPFLI